jgi:hypothetical protein
MEIPDTQVEGWAAHVQTRSPTWDAEQAGADLEGLLAAKAIDVKISFADAPWRKMPGDEHLAVIRHEAQLFDKPHRGFQRWRARPRDR